jgi:hypothetical protein
MKLYPANTRKLVSSILHLAGNTSPELRQAVEASAARDGGAVRPDVTLPDDLQWYIDKVSHYAYKVTDEDIRVLKVAGYSEDQLLEITISAAIGAGLARLEKGLSLLEEID